MSAPYAEWAARWARGMEASAPLMDARREAQAAVAKANRAAGAQRPCAIIGCKRHSYKGRLCRLHWKQVPRDLKVEAMVAAMVAQRKAADRYHVRFRTAVQALNRYPRA